MSKIPLKQMPFCGTSPIVTRGEYVLVGDQTDDCQFQLCFGSGKSDWMEPEIDTEHSLGP